MTGSSAKVDQAERQPSALRLVPFALPVLGLIWLAGAARAQDELIVSHGYNFFGELRYAADFEHLDYVNPDAPQGGEMSFSWSSGLFDSVHPYTTQGRPDVLSGFPFETMLTGTSDEVGSAYCLMCETLSYPETVDYVIFTLREGITFSDGSEMTVEDVMFSYEILRDEGPPSFSANLPNTLVGAEILDERRIRFDFNPDSSIRVRVTTAGGIPIMSQASHEASGLDFDEARLEPLIGTGPYVLTDLESGTRVEYERNRDYWGDGLAINVGRNNFDSIRLEYYSDGTAAFEGFKAGNYLWRQENTSRIWATQYDFPSLASGVVVQQTLPNGNIASGQSFSINLDRPQFQDPRVREAIGLMFNFEWTNRALFYDLYSPIDSYWENTDLEAVGLPEGDELALLEPFRDRLPAEVFEEPAFATPASDPDNALDRRNARLAIRLLQEAGWEPGDDGVLRNEAGETLEVEFLNSSPAFDRLINPFVENLIAIGVDARLVRIDNAQLRERTVEADFDIITDHFPMAEQSSNGLRQYFGTIGLTDRRINSPGLSDPVVDELIEIVISADTLDDLATATRALDRVLRWQHIRVPQWYNNSYWVAYYDMYRYPEPLPPYGLGYLDFWWVDPAAEAALRDAGEI